jgi:hypothetical protein
VQHTSELGQPKRLHSGWAKYALGNGGEDGKDKEKFKGYPRQEDNLRR